MAIKRLFTPADQEIQSISDQFEHLRNISPPSFPCGPALTKDQIADFVEAAYWSSLLENERRSTHVRLAAVTQQARVDMQKFSSPISYDEFQIAKLGPAVPSMGCLLVDLSRMEIWGISREQLPFETITLNVVRPGVVQVGVGVYRTFLVFAGRTTTQVLSTGHIDLAQLISKALRKGLPTDDYLETQAVWLEALALADIARSVVKNGHGGALLIVPKDDDKWHLSIAPLAFRFDIEDSSIPDSIRSRLKRNIEHGAALQAVLQTGLSDTDKFTIASNFPYHDLVDRDAIDAIARLAAIDGAVVLTSEARVIGFGAKINVKEGPSVSLISPDSERQKINSCELQNLGGMRHQSAARFVGANHNCAALVVSEDGPMSFMSWNAELHRVLDVKNADWWC